jgi:hypothetical protein
MNVRQAKISGVHYKVWLPELGKRKRVGYRNTFEFQISMNNFCISMSHAIFGTTYTKNLLDVYLEFIFN